MRSTLAVQMDNPLSLDPQKDTTLALLYEAYRREYNIYSYQPEHLSMESSGVSSYVRRVEFIVENQSYRPVLGESEHFNLESSDVLLMRQDPPFDMNYICATYLLELLPKKCIKINSPSSVRSFPEKLIPYAFKDYMPSTLITRSKELILKFMEVHPVVVFKPLFGHGGNMVFKVTKEDPNFNALVEVFSDASKEPWIVQEFLEGVKDGDTRVLIINGSVAGAFRRRAHDQEIRTNLVRGGHSEQTVLTPQEARVSKDVAAFCAKHDLFFTGIDLIQGKLTEVNITSPTGIKTIEALNGDNLSEYFWDKVQSNLRNAS